LVLTAAAGAGGASALTLPGRLFFIGGGADRFLYETPYTEGSGKTHGTVATQRKRLTVLTTEQPFPSLLRRLPVVKQEEVRAPSPASCT
jgi:hypothetical protein